MHTLQTLYASKPDGVSAAGIKFDFSVNTDWQPVNSQRLLLWAGKFGKQEEFMTALNKRHFEQRKSASEDATLVETAVEVAPRAYELLICCLRVANVLPVCRSLVAESRTLVYRWRRHLALEMLIHDDRSLALASQMEAL